MTIFLNNEQTDLPDGKITILDLLEIKKINPQGTAIAIEDQLIPKSSWDKIFITPSMNITVITAAFGG